MTLRLATLATAAFVAAPPAVNTGGPGLVLGATEDAVRSSSPAVAKAQMDLLVRVDGALVVGLEVGYCFFEGQV